MTDHQERDTEREAFEAWADGEKLALNRHHHSYISISTSWCWDAWQARAARSQQQQQAFEAGWRTAANWVNRDDLIADIGSPAYIKDRDAALSDLTGGGNG